MLSKMGKIRSWQVTRSRNADSVTNKIISSFASVAGSYYVKISNFSCPLDHCKSKLSPSDHPGNFNLVHPPHNEQEPYSFMLTTTTHHPESHWSKQSPHRTLYAAAR